MVKPVSESQQVLNQLFTFLNEKEKELLGLARAEAIKLGLDIGFEGWFKQGTIEEPESEEKNPFVIAQTREEIKRLQQGILEGIILERMDKARISDGVISPTSVIFSKTYLSSRSNTAFVISYEYLVTSVHAPIIIYNGTNKGDGIYRGEWNFNPVKGGNMQSRGSFQMRRVFQASY